jgi:hypothetical protein
VVRIGVADREILGELGVSAEMVSIGGMSRDLARPAAVGVAALTTDACGGQETQRQAPARTAFTQGCYQEL